MTMIYLTWTTIEHPHAILCGQVDQQDMTQTCLLSHHHWDSGWRQIWNLVLNLVPPPLTLQMLKVWDLLCKFLFISLEIFICIEEYSCTPLYLLKHGCQFRCLQSLCWEANDKCRVARWSNQKIPNLATLDKWSFLQLECEKTLGSAGHSRSIWYIKLYRYITTCVQNWSET